VGRRDGLAGFTTPLLQWLAGVNVHSPMPMKPLTAGRIGTSAFVDTLTSFRAAVPWIVARQQMLLLGSHDTARIKTALGGDPALLRVAFGLLLTYPGVPCIYYGDEVGLEAGDSLAARGTFPWDGGWDDDLLAFVRSLVSARRRLSALTRGGFQMLSVETDSMSYVRDSDAEVVIVVANRGPANRSAGRLDLAHAGIPNGLEMRHLVSGDRSVVTDSALPLPDMPPGIAIYTADRRTKR